MRGSREISLVPSLHRASTDALIAKIQTPVAILSQFCVFLITPIKISREKGENVRGCWSHNTVSRVTNYFAKKTTMDG